MYDADAAWRAEEPHVPRPDLRLAVVAIGVWAGALLVLYTSAMWGAAAVAGAFTIVVACQWRRVRRSRCGPGGKGVARGPDDEVAGLSRPAVSVRSSSGRGRRSEPDPAAGTVLRHGFAARDVGTEVEPRQRGGSSRPDAGASSGDRYGRWPEPDPAAGMVPRHGFAARDEVPEPGGARIDSGPENAEVDPTLSGDTVTPRRGRFGDRWRGLLAVVAMGLAAGAAVTSAHAAVRDAAPLSDWVAEKRAVTVEVTVSDDPLLLRGGKGETYRVPVSVERVRDGNDVFDVSVRAVMFGTDIDGWRWREVLPGQRLTVEGRLDAASGVDLDAAKIWVDRRPRVSGEPPWWQTAAGYLRTGLRHACAEMPDEPGGLLPGLALGDVSGLDAKVDEDFRETGMTHLLAVSGSNVAIVVGAAVAVAAGCGAGRRARTVIGIAVLVGFVVLVRPSPSVLRAAVMGGLALLVLVRRNGGEAVPVLSAAVAILLLVDPGLAVNLGFVLSVAATAGLVLFASRWSRTLRRRGWPLWLAAAVAVPAAAQLAVTPALAAATGTITPVAVLANALAAIAVAPATVLTVLATLIWPLWSDAAVALVWLASWPAWWLIAVADHAARIPSGTVPWPSGAVPGLVLALALLVILWLSRWRAGRRLLLVVVLGVVVGVAPVRLLHGGWPPPGWVMVACDVGQGDALVLPTDVESRAIVIDTGPAPREVDRCLRELGVDRVALLVLSHGHADHVDGARGVYSGRVVEAVLPPAPGQPGFDRRQLAKTIDGTPKLEVYAGQSIRAGDTRLEVLGPDVPFTGTRSDPNNNSFVLRATVSGVSILLSGDVEEPAQRAVLNSAGRLSADVLKVPHHGSGYFDAEFFEAVDPRVAVFSVGSGNDYGHPHPRTVRQLRQQGASVLRTDRDGTVAVVVDDGELAVMTTN